MAPREEPFPSPSIRLPAQENTPWPEKAPPQLEAPPESMEHPGLPLAAPTTAHSSIADDLW